eukprot:2525084-Amphidinium_carterae.1
MRRWRDRCEYIEASWRVFKERAGLANMVLQVGGLLCLVWHGGGGERPWVMAAVSGKEQEIVPHVGDLGGWHGN